MATTVTCDRCGEPIRTEISRYTIHDPARYDGSQSVPRKHDLCERCAKSFADWINPPRADASGDK